jgi:hypothetical protein
MKSIDKKKRTVTLELPNGKKVTPKVDESAKAFDEEYFIGSADIMKRNLEHRVEVVAPVASPALRRGLRAMLDAQRNDRRRAWGMRADGTYVQRKPAAAKDGRDDCRSGLGVPPRLPRLGAPHPRGPEPAQGGAAGGDRPAVSPRVRLAGLDHRADP